MIHMLIQVMPLWEKHFLKALWIICFFLSYTLWGYNRIYVCLWEYLWQIFKVVYQLYYARKSSKTIELRLAALGLAFQADTQHRSEHTSTFHLVVPRDQWSPECSLLFPESCQHPHFIREQKPPLAMADLSGYSSVPQIFLRFYRLV